MTLLEKQHTFSLNVAKLILWAYEKGYKITLGEAERPEQLQALYVKSGKSKTMKSGHLKRLAIDLNLFSEGKYKTDMQAHEPLHEYWESLHPDNAKAISWDANHYEML
jgi:hypothetical protein